MRQTTPSRSRVAWWLYVFVLVGVALFIAHSFVGLLVLGVFGYYATRPICDHLSSVVDSERLAAILTVLAVLVPVFGVVLYAGFEILRQLQRRFDEGLVSMLTSRLTNLEAIPGTEETSLSVILRNPPSLAQLPPRSFGPGLEQAAHVLDAVFGTLLLLVLALVLTYALLEYDGPIADGFAELVGGRDTTVYAYALAVDDDLESIFFGNLLFVVIMSVVATATYAATNVVAPTGIQVPMVFTLGFLTGAASLIPLVVGKVVYLPLVGYLGFQATRTGDGGLVFVGGVLVVYVLVLDLLPQSLIQPYVSGRQLDTLILLFAYVLGPMLFGWYGFFLLPIVFVLMLETVRIVLPELLHGESLAPRATVAQDTGANLDDVRDSGSADTPDTTTSAEDGGAAQN